MTQARPDGKLLAADEVEPVCLAGSPLAPGPLLLLGDHAGRLFPRALGEMGLDAEDRARHIALDLGVEQLGRDLSARLGAPFIWQAYSRLVVDCNRDPGAPDSVPETSDGTPIPANCGLSSVQRAARMREFHEPYHEAIAELIELRADVGLRTILVALHSFTPIHEGVRRAWDAGVLHGGPGDAYGWWVLRLLQAQGDWLMGDNQPYAFDGTDYTIPRHAFPRALPWLELEVRQDHLSSPGKVADVAARLAPVLAEAAEEER